MEKVGRINRRQGFIVGEYWLRFISPPPRLRQEMERLLNCYAIRQTNNPPCIPFVSRTVYTGVLHNSGSLSRSYGVRLCNLIIGYLNFPLLSTREKEKVVAIAILDRSLYSKFFLRYFCAFCNTRIQVVLVKCITLQ